MFERYADSNSIDAQLLTSRLGCSILLPYYTKDFLCNRPLYLPRKMPQMETESLSTINSLPSSAFIPAPSGDDTIAPPPPIRADSSLPAAVRAFDEFMQRKE